MKDVQDNKRNIIQHAFDEMRYVSYRGTREMLSRFSADMAYHFRSEERKSAGQVKEIEITREQGDLLSFP